MTKPKRSKYIGGQESYESTRKKDKDGKYRPVAAYCYRCRGTHRFGEACHE